MSVTMDALILAGLVALGGGIGAVARFWVSARIARRFGEGFPWGTLVVNVTGAAAIGVLAALLLVPETHAVQHRGIWTALVIGTLGSYTTVSSFSLQTLGLARSGRPAHALANVALSLGLCLGASAAAFLTTALAVTAWSAA